MAVITVPASGIQVSDVTLDDRLQAGSDVDPTSGAVGNYEVDGTSTLRSLYVGSAVEVDIGFFNSATLRGTGTVTGDNDPNLTAPTLVNYGILDINGAIDIELDNNGQVIVSPGERLDLEGRVFGLGASTVTVAAGSELDINSQNTAIISALSSQGTLNVTAPNASLSGATTLAGTVTVRGDALNAVGNGVPAARSTGATYVATLDLRQTTLSAPITNLTLGQDAQARFGAGPTTIQRLAIAGSATALVPLDVVSVDGDIAVTGDGSGTANQVSISGAEFTGGHTVDFTVGSAGGGASLSGQVVVDSNTVLRNDGAMTIGGQGGGSTSIGATSAAPGSALVNGAAGQLTLASGAALSVAAVNNAGAITVAGNVSLLQSLTNTGTVDVASGTLSLEAATTGAGTITVENGATLAIDAASSGGTVALHTGGVLRLSQPSTFASTIQAQSAGAQIDLAGAAVTSATVSNGSIAVTTSAGTFNLAETGLINGATLGIGSDNAGGSVLTIPAGAASSTTAVYRFFDDIHGTHFFTASLSETQMLQATRSDLVYEGVGLNAVSPASDPAAAPVYRFFDTNFGTHFYTSSATERDTVAVSRPDLTYEGIGFYEHTNQQSGDVPVYRFFDSNFGTHFYTDSASERATIVATRPDLISEGVGFYAPST